MSMQRRSLKALPHEPGALDFFGEPRPLQFNDESNSDDDFYDVTAPDYVVISNKSILCVSCKAEADQFRGCCAEQYTDEETQSFIG